MESIAIVGGGIAGLTTAIGLSQLGIPVTVYEGADAFRTVGAGIVLAGNAMLALRKFGIEDEVIAVGERIRFFEICDHQRKTIARTDAEPLFKKYGVESYAFHRAELQQVLLDALGIENVKFGHRLKSIQNHSDQVTLAFENGEKLPTGYVVAADGANSTVRQNLLPQASCRYSGYTCFRGVIDDPGLALSQTSESWGPGRRFGMVPLSGQRIYWFACLNASRNDSKIADFQVSDLSREFSGFADPVGVVIRATRNEDLIWNDIVDLKPISKYAFGRTLLVGDSAHAMTPNMGQGACQAIEDAAVLCDALARQANPLLAFQSFEQRRLKRTHRIVNTSWKIGRIGQLQNGILRALRNLAFRCIPDSVSQKQLEALFQVDF